jgi:hypothetical protein
MSASQPPSNPLDEIRSGITESPPQEEFKAGIADKQPLLQNNQPRYAFGWFDKWLLVIPVILLLLLCYLGWAALNPATNAPTASALPTSSAASTAPTTSGASTSPKAVTGISLNAPSGGTTVAVGQSVTLSGQAPPGSEVQLLNRGKQISTTTADANGYYEFNLSAAQPGVYELQTVTTINGNQITSPPVTVTVTGQTANATSVATGNTPGASATADVNASGGATATTAAPQVISLQTATSPVMAAIGQPLQLTGTAPPGATVELYNDGKLLATTTADANGNYTFDLIPETAGEYKLQATTTVNGQPVSSSPVMFIVPEASAGTTPSATVTPGAGESATSTANQAITPSAESTSETANGGTTGGTNNTNAIPPAVNLPANAILTAGAVLTGTAPPNSHVVIYFNDKESGSANADANGAYQFTLPETLPPSEYTVRVVVTDANGTPLGSPSEAQPVTIIPKMLLPVTGGEFK